MSTKKITLLSRNIQETKEIAAVLARKLNAGSIVALFGQLGAGKTAFVKSCCEALGVKDQVTSPSFTIMNLYNGESLPVFHFDFYRLSRNSDWNELGLTEYLFDDGVSFIEWPDRLDRDSLKDAIEVTLKFVTPLSKTTADHRIIEIRNVNLKDEEVKRFLFAEKSR